MRWAGKRCSLTSTGVPDSSVVTRWHFNNGAPIGTLQQPGLVRRGAVGTDRLRRPTEAHVEQLVERVLLDVGPRQVLAELGRAPHRDHGERLAVGEVDPLDAEHGVDTEQLANAPGRLAEGELDDAAFVGDATAIELGLDRAQLAEMLTHRLGRDEPPEPLAGGDESVVTQHVEGSTDRHPAGAELRGQLGLARQQRTGGCRAHPLTERVGDLPIADPPHPSAFASPNRGWSDSRTCIRVVYVSTNCKPVSRGGPP